MSRFDFIEQELRVIKAETKTNGGSTMRDEIKSIHTDTKALMNSVILTNNLIKSSMYLDKDPVTHADAQGNCIFVNQAWMALTGYIDISQAKGTGWKRAIYSKDIERVYSEWQECVRTKTQFISEYRHQNVNTGIITPVRCKTSIIYDSEGTINMYIAVLEILPINSNTIHKFYLDEPENNK